MGNWFSWNVMGNPRYVDLDEVCYLECSERHLPDNVGHDCRNPETDEMEPCPETAYDVVMTLRNGVVVKASFYDREDVYRIITILKKE